MTTLSLHELVSTLVGLSIFQILITSLGFLCIMPYFVRKHEEYKKKDFDDKVNREVNKRISELEGYKDEK